MRLIDADTLKESMRKHYEEKIREYEKIGNPMSSIMVEGIKYQMEDEFARIDNVPTVSIPVLCEDRERRVREMTPKKAKGLLGSLYSRYINMMWEGDADFNYEKAILAAYEALDSREPENVACQTEESPGGKSKWYFAGCPSCGKRIEDWRTPNYCPECGQHLNWE